MTISLRRFPGWWVIGVITAIAAMVGVARAEPLKEEHQGTVADCNAGVEWHFVHNQTAATHGVITVGSQRVPNGAPHQAAVLHYWVTTAANVLPDGVADNVVGGKLLLSGYACRPGSSTTTTTSTTTSTTSTTSSTTSTTTTERPPIVDEVTTTTTGPTTTTAAPAVTTTTTASKVLPKVGPATAAEVVAVAPDFTG